VNGDGSFIAHDIEPRSTATQARVHVVDGIHDDAAGPEELGVHLVHVVAAIHRVARDERHRRGPLRDERRQPGVVIGRCAEADQLSLRPRAAAMHRCVNPARIGRLTRVADAVVVAVTAPVARRVERLDGDAGPVAHRFVGADLRGVVLLPALLCGGLELRAVVRLVHPVSLL
jgi:hypothetical protein